MSTSVIEFPETVAACKAAERSQWAIGDALVKECPIGKSGVKGAGDRLRDATIEVARHCADTYTYQMLRKLRETANAFQNDKRLSFCSWAVHDIARDPETLERIVQTAKNEGVAITANLARRVRTGHKKVPTPSKGDPAERLQNALHKIIKRTYAAFHSVEHVRKRAYTLDPSVQKACMRSIASIRDKLDAIERVIVGETIEGVSDKRTRKKSHLKYVA